MNVLLQRVRRACVEVDGKRVSEIGPGLLAYVGIQKADTAKELERMAERLVNYRVFPDSEGKMNLSILDHGGGILAVSQFTLAADTKKGNRPSFSSAMSPELAEKAFNQFIEHLKSLTADLDIPVFTGQFQAHMEIESINSGPINFLLSVEAQPA